MGRDGRPVQSHIIGPNGTLLTLADLPSPKTKRWVPRRKAEIVAAVRGGLLSLEDACARYALSLDEFMSWQSALEQYGLTGLRGREMQEHRSHA
jgi:Protein of unknown function (DUF1153)